MTIEPLVMLVLVALAEEVGETLSRDDLVVRCWGRRIVGDDAVNRVISRLRRNLADVARGSVRVQTIAKVGYRLQVAAVSDTNASNPADVLRRVTPPARSTRRLMAGGTLSLAALIAVSGVFFLRAPTPAIAMAIEPAAGETSARTARFASELSGDVAGLTGTMTRLAFVEPGAPTAADLVLKVAYTTGMSGYAARTRLVDSSNGAVIWSREFAGSGQPDDALRERVARAVAGVIRCGLDRSAGDLGDPVSKRLFFAACDAVGRRDWSAALRFEHQILARRPDSAASWACVAITIVLGGQEPSAGNGNVARLALRYARKAVAIDPHSGLAHQALAMALGLQGRDNFGELEAGVRSDPEHGWLLALYGSALFNSGYPAAATSPILRATVLEPGDPEMARTAFRVLLGAGRLTDARDLAGRMARVWPDDAGSRRAIDELLVYDADPAAALKKLEQAGGLDEPYREVLRAQLKWRAAPWKFDWPAFDRLAERLYASDPEAAWWLALGAIRMGDEQRAIGWLGRSHASPTSVAPWAELFGPDAARLRRDPRFFSKMAEVGMVDFWRSRDRWPEFCADKLLRYSCRDEAERLIAERNAGKI